MEKLNEAHRPVRVETTVSGWRATYEISRDGLVGYARITRSK